MPSGLIFNETPSNETLGHNEPSAPPTWRLGVLTDNDGHVHLGAVVAGQGSEQATYVNLLSAVGAASAAEVNLGRVLILGHPQDLAQLRQIAERCIDNDRLRRQVVDLAAQTESRELVRRTWTA